MEPTILRCFQNMIAVMYKIEEFKTVIIYELYQEEYGEIQRTFEERNFIPEEDMEETGRRRSRTRLRQIMEVENWVVAGVNLHDMFFLDRDTLCLMINSDMVVWKILRAENESPLRESTYKAEYTRIKISGHDNRRLDVRHFRLDRKGQCLYYFHGKKIWVSYLLKQYTIKYGEKMMAAGTIDLRQLNQFFMESNSQNTAIEEEDEPLVTPTTMGLTDALIKSGRPTDVPYRTSDVPYRTTGGGLSRPTDGPSAFLGENQ